MEKTFNLDNLDLREFWGINNKNFRFLENIFSSLNLLERSSKLVISGEEKEINDLHCTFKYKPKNDETDVIAIGLPVVSFGTLGEAKEAVKSLISETKKDYIIQTIKIPNNSISVIGRYTPASTAKEGTYIVFGKQIIH